MNENGSENKTNRLKLFISKSLLDINILYTNNLLKKYIFCAFFKYDNLKLTKKKKVCNNDEIMWRNSKGI